MRKKPAVFVGCSTEGQRFGKTVQVLLEVSCEATFWNQGVFGLGLGTLESLALKLNDFDFAILILTPDDLVTKRGGTFPSARDNVLFELGLFIGALGRERTFIVHERATRLELPSDLAGVTTASFETHSSGNLESSLGPVVARIEAAIDRLGLRNQLSGAIQVFPRRTYMPPFDQILRSVKDGTQVSVQGVSLSALLPFHVNLIAEKVLQHKVRFRMLLMRHDASIVETFGDEIGEGEAFKSQLAMQRHNVSNLLAKLAKSSSSVDVRTYNTIPFNSILHYVNHDGAEIVYIVIYLNGRPGAECPLIKITRDRPEADDLFDEVMQSFNHLWKRATPYKP